MMRNIFSVQFIEYREAPVIKVINAPGSIVVTDSTAMRSNTTTYTSTSTATNSNTQTSTERGQTTTHTMTPGGWIHGGDPPRPDADPRMTLGPEIKKGIKTPILEGTAKPMKGVEMGIVHEHRISAPEFENPANIPNPEGPGGLPGGFQGIYDEDQDETSGRDSDNDDDDDDDQDSDNDKDSDQPPDSVIIPFGELGIEPPFSDKE
ncbi:MAG: hypothetical protein ACFFER_14775 [Candidatus Thorarchaeota archaeon]